MATIIKGQNNVIKKTKIEMSMTCQFLIDSLSYISIWSSRNFSNGGVVSSRKLALWLKETNAVLTAKNC